MKVLRIHSWDGGEAGGGEAYVRTVSRMLTSLGHEQKILAITSTPSDFFGKEATNLIVPTMGAERSIGDSLENREVGDALTRVLQEFQPDLVHLHHFDAAFASIGRALRSSKVPVVFTAHDAELVCPISTLVLPDGSICEGGVRVRCGFTGCKVGFGLPYNLWQRTLFDELVKPRVKAYFCPSEALATYLHNNGFRPAVQLPSFATIPGEVMEGTSLGHEKRTSRIGFMGRLEAYKGLEDLFLAFSQMRASGREVFLDIAGGGEMTERFKDMARELGISDAIAWSGWVTGETKEKWFRDQRLLVVPSRPFENFPLVALEALAREIPVVATDAGGAKDIVRDGETGLLVPHSNPGRLSQAILKLLDEPELAERLAANGRKMVLSEFTPEIHVRRLTEAYDKIVAGEELPSITGPRKGRRKV